MSSTPIESSSEIEEILRNVFEEGLDAGSDVVLDRQFEHDPDVRTRYIQRSVKESVAAIEALITAEYERGWNDCANHIAVQSRILSAKDFRDVMTQTRKDLKGKK